MIEIVERRSWKMKQLLFTLSFQRFDHFYVEKVFEFIEKLNVAVRIIKFQEKKKKNQRKLSAFAQKETNPIEREKKKIFKS